MKQRREVPKLRGVGDLRSRKPDTAFERMSGLQRIVYYAAVVLTVSGITLISYVLSIDLKTTEFEMLRDVFMDCLGYPKMSILYLSAVTLGPLGGVLIAIRMG